MHETYRTYIRDYVPIIVETAFVFLPYFVFRPLFPKTSFRDSLGKDRNKTDKNRVFFVIVTWITKIFYVWAKHYIGFFLNYARSCPLSLSVCLSMSVFLALQIPRPNHSHSSPSHLSDADLLCCCHHHLDVSSHLKVQEVYRPQDLLSLVHVFVPRHLLFVGLSSSSRLGLISPPHSTVSWMSSSSRGTSLSSPSEGFSSTSLHRCLSSATSSSWLGCSIATVSTNSLLRWGSFFSLLQSNCLNSKRGDEDMMNGFQSLPWLPLPLCLSLCLVVTPLTKRLIQFCSLSLSRDSRIFTGVVSWGWCVRGGLEVSPQRERE
jgi:hypothetical protein